MFRNLREFSPNELEEKVLKFWDENQIFKKSIKGREGRKPFSFYDGPPFANGLPHYGHILVSVIKDTVTRFWTMMGYKVERRVGWDCHGLPVEYEIEKQLGIKSKKDIEKFGIAKFNQAAKESVFRYTKEWEGTLKRVGRWADYSNAYATLDPAYTESVWWVLKQLWNKGLVYKDYRVSPYCPRCGTPLSNFEVSQGYKDTEDESIFIKFKVSASGGSAAGGKSSKLKIKNEKSEIFDFQAETYLLAWTTTPWTLPGNVSLAVNPDASYVVARQGEASYILAEDRLSILTGEYETLRKMKGKELVGMRYEPLFNSLTKEKVKNIENAFQVLPADFVLLTDGTGIVHSAVMYGEDDFQLGKKFDLPMHHTVFEDGRFTDAVAEWAGEFVKDAEGSIIKNLEERGLLYKKEKVIHSYPFCWRCDRPLLYYALNSWYVRVSELRDDLVRNNEKVHWVPEHVKEGRFGSWLREARDWNFSRNRFWGAPLPIFECRSCSKPAVVGSLRELSDLAPVSGNRYYILRHGQADSNVLNIMDSIPEHFDINLTKKGEGKIRKIMNVLKKRKIDLIFSSPLKRTKETAEIIRKELVLPVHYDNRLEEYNAGVFNGRPVEDFFAFIGDPKNGFTKAPDKGETWNDTRRRMMNFILNLERKYKNKNILIIGHGDPLWLLEGASQGVSDGGLIAARENYIEPGELREIKLLNLPYNEDGVVDLHRPFIDNLLLECPSCEGQLVRAPGVFDCWFESGSMPYAQWHYPFFNKELVENTFPADFIAEGLDQTRGWFYTLHVLAAALTGDDIGLGTNQPAFKNVIVNGSILSESGQKLSKRLRNYTEPEIVFEKYGADSLRFFLLSSTPIGEDYRFFDKGVIETKNKTVDRILNSYNFLSLYGDKKYQVAGNKYKGGNVLDRWIIGRLNQTIKEMTDSFSGYELTEGSRFLILFLDDLSNWYIRRSRRRLQKPKNKKDYEEAYKTLANIMLDVSRLMAPIAPFAGDGLYKGLGDLLNLKLKESVHLDDWPKANLKAIDKNLFDDMEEVRRLASLGLARRAAAGIKVRQPLLELRVKNEGLKGKKDFLGILKDEVNVKKIIFKKTLGEEVELNAEITPELKEEGTFRELVRLVQGLRQEAGFQPKDIIVLLISGTKVLTGLFERKEKEFKKEVGAEKIAIGKRDKFDAEIDTKIEDEKIWIGIRKA